MSIRFYIILILCSLSFLLRAQEEKDYDDLQIENLIEQFIENNEIEEIDITDIIERFGVLKTRPLNINTATENDLTALFFLTPIEINAILTHRQDFGNYLALEELQTIDQLDFEKIRTMAPYLTIKARDREKYDFKGLIESGKSNLFIKYKRILQEKKGYQSSEDEDKKYAGTPNHYYMRYRFDSGRALKGGFTVENDPGEPFFSGINKNGFDFYSAYVYAEKVTPWLKAINLGDYTVSMGQGLILHNAFGAGKSIYTIDIKKDGQPIRHYSSVNEINFFRGIGLTVEPVKNTALTIFYSSKDIDGTLNLDTTEIDDFGTFNSIARSGLHRTTSEIEKKGGITQTNYGGTLQYRFKNFNVGVNHLTYAFSSPIAKSDQPYRQFYFSGDQLSNTSLDYSLRYKNITTFGEIARSNNGGIAQIHSAIMSLDKRLDIAISYRNFAKDYQTIEGNAFSEGTLPINEQAIYFGLESRINHQWKISSYIDFWKNPWLRYRVDAPGTGREFLFRIDHMKKRTYNLYLQYRYETKNINSSVSENKVDPIVFTHSHRARLHFSYKLTKEFEIRSRIEGSAFSKDNNQTYGYLIYQDIFYKPLEYPFALNARIALFDTDGFDTRIYTYENDLLYEFYIPFFQQQGMRSYLNFKYKIRRNIGWEFKIARTLLSNQETIGSGNELINGNRRTEFKTQLKISF